MKKLFIVLLTFLSCLNLHALVTNFSGKTVTLKSATSISTDKWYVLKSYHGTYLYFTGKSNVATTVWGVGDKPSSTAASSWTNYMFNFSNASKGAIKAANGQYMSISSTAGYGPTAIWSSTSPYNFMFLWSSGKLEVRSIDQWNGASYYYFYSPNKTGKISYKAYDTRYEFNWNYAKWTLYEVVFSTSVTSISLNKTSVTTSPGAKVTLTATVSPSNATNKSVTWSTSNSSIATVSNTGVVTAVAAGNCVITCTAADGSGKKATCNVIVHGGPSGVEAVDLGLPSGTLWANMNVGATSPEKYGGYYAWGEITTKMDHTWKNYRFGTKGAVTKYNAQDGLTKLLDADDAAYVNWGEDWLMPTEAELLELRDNCTITEKHYCPEKSQKQTSNPYLNKPSIDFQAVERSL